MTNGALYFVDEVMPRFMEYLYHNYEVKTIKEYWENLAKQDKYNCDYEGTGEEHFKKH